jgi:hypothetical protein
MTPLDQREIAVLTALANGKIAKQLYLTDKAEYHRAYRAIFSARQKLKAETTYHAIALAVSLGLVTVERINK